MEIKVTKLTDVSLLRLANRFTSGKESNMTLATAYKLGHTTIRTQKFVVLMRDIPLFVASQLVRTKAGVDWYMRSKRRSRGGKDFRETCKNLSNNLRHAVHEDDDEWILVTADNVEELFKDYDRLAPTDLMGDMNAETLINIGHKRLCSKASGETIAIVGIIRDRVREVDPDLAAHMVPQCIYRGGICPEAKPCGLHRNQKFLNAYRILFA